VQAFGELSPRQKRIEVARWIVLVPAALVASIAAEHILGALVQAIRGITGPTSSTAIGFWALVAPCYVLPKFVLVLTGGWIAPRKQLAVALLIALVGTILSLLQHVILQHFAGNHPGPTNYTHFALETAGLLAGVVFIHRRRIAPRDIDGQSGSSGAHSSI
jgi:hypothetical protein